MTTLAEARSKLHIKPVYIFDIALLDSGAPTLYFSDRNITVSGNIYEDYINNVPNIQEEVRFLDSSGLNSDINIVFKNDKYKGQDYLIILNESFPFSGAAVTITELYILDDGTQSDSEVIFVGVLDNPANINLDTFECGVSNKVTGIDEKYTQKLFSFEDYPYMSATAIGRIVNAIGYGSPGKIRATAIVGGATTLILEEIDATQDSFTVKDTTRFPTVPFTIQIEKEQMSVTLIVNDKLYVTRETSGDAVVHTINNEVFEVRTEYVYHLFDSPIKTINNVYVDNVIQNSGFTAYTGQTGDEHSDYPGKAIISFATSALLQKQVNLSTEEAVERASGTSLSEDPTNDNLFTPTVSRYSADFQSLSVGEVLYQYYNFTIQNDSSTYEDFIFTVNDPSNSQVLKLFNFRVSAGSTETFTVKCDTDVWNTFISIAQQRGRSNWSVSSMTRTMYYLASALSPSASGALIDIDQPVFQWSHGYVFNEEEPVTVGINTPVRWISYSEEARDGTVRIQTHRATITNTSGVSTSVFIAGINESGISYKDEYTIVNGQSREITVEQIGGNWYDRTVVGISLATVGAEVVVTGIGKTVSYAPNDVELLTDEATYGSSSEVVIGLVIVADVDLIQDDGSGTYTGTPDSLIQVPADIITYSLINNFGFAAGEIDTATFAAARALHVASALQFDFIVDFGLGQDAKRSSTFLQELAWQCGSVLRFKGSKWYLDFIIGLPPQPIRTISKDELVGKTMFEFNETSRDAVRNKLITKYNRNYGKFETDAKEADWKYVYELFNQGSIDVFGERVENIDFWAVVDLGTVQTVIDFQLQQRATPFVLVDFTIFFEHFDLKVGDTFNISNPIYDGRRFFIETMNKVGKSSISIGARSWTGRLGSGDYLVFVDDGEGIVDGDDAIKYYGTDDIIKLY